MFNSIRAGNQIAFLRKQKGITQEELAEKLEISAQAISKWENGHTMPETAMLPLLSKLLDSSIDSILMPLTDSENTSFIESIEEINRIDKTTAKKLLDKIDKKVIAKALKGVSPIAGEYLKELFPGTDLISLGNKIGPVRISEMEEIHAQIINAINQKVTGSEYIK